MAERFVRFDDLDGTVIDEGTGATVTIGLGEEQYDLDLKEANLETLRKAVAPFLEAGRKAEAARTEAATASVPSTGTTKGTQKATTNGATASVPRQTSRSAMNREQLAVIRKWAKKNKFKVSERGRIPNAVMAAYMRDNMATASPRAS